MNKYNIKHSIYASITILFSCFIIWIIYMANAGQNNAIFEIVKATPYGDKIGHLLLFGLLTLVLNFGLKFRMCIKGKYLLGTIVVLMFVIVEESSQYWIPTRTFDGIDLIADFIGILLFDFISRRLNKLRS